MPAASGTFKQVAYKKETTYGVLPTASGAQLLRRTKFSANLSKDTYESNEIRADFQTADMRHGVRKVPASLSGELSPGSYSPIMGSILKRDFAAVTAMTGLSITVAGTGPTYTITRSAGSWLTSGVKIGQVMRLTAGTFNVANSNKNLFITALTATVATVIVLNGSALVAEGPIASATASLPGKVSYIPTTGHTDDSYAFEEWFADIARSETWVGLKFSQMAVQLPPTGLATVEFSATGKDLGQTPSGTRYFTSPTPQGTSGVVAAVNGLLRVNGVTQAAVTGLNFTVAPSFTGDPVVGQNTVPNQFPGRIKVTGQFTAYFEDGVLPALFADEVELGIQVALTTSNAAAADFVAFSLSRVKLGGADKDDGDGGVVRTYPFTALLDSAGGAGLATEATTISVQDSLA